MTKDLAPSYIKSISTLFSYNKYYLRAYHVTSSVLYAKDITGNKIDKEHSPLRNCQARNLKTIRKMGKELE